MNCIEFQHQLQLRLDGELQIDSLGVEQHVLQCAKCRALESAVQRLECGLGIGAAVALPPGLSERIVRHVLAARRARRRYRRGVLSAAVAATLLLAAFIAYSRLRVSPGDAPAPVAKTAPTNEPPPAVALQRSVREAGSALVSLMGRTADEAIEQGRILFPSSLARTAVVDGDSSPLDPPVRSLREAGEGVSAGLQPVTRSARRAVDLFLREIPGEAGNQK